MIACILTVRDAGAEVKSAPATFSSFAGERYEPTGFAVGSGMNTFSDLPRYPATAVDPLDGPPDTDGSIRGAITIAQVAGELLALAAPIIACLWWIVFFPVLFGLLLFAASQHERR